MLNRLQHLIPEFPPRKSQTWETTLSRSSGQYSSFLRFKESFDLTNKNVICYLLANKGGYKTIFYRHARVRVQSQLSDIHKSEHGTPQGGRLSPFLFNMLDSRLMEIPFPADAQLLAYADDIQLVATGSNC